MTDHRRFLRRVRPPRRRPDRWRDRIRALVRGRRAPPRPVRGRRPRARCSRWARCSGCSPTAATRSCSRPSSPPTRRAARRHWRPCASAGSRSASPPPCSPAGCGSSTAHDADPRVALVFAVSILATTVYTSAGITMRALGHAGVEGANETISRVAVLAVGWWLLARHGGLLAAAGVYALADLALRDRPQRAVPAGASAHRVGPVDTSRARAPSGCAGVPRRRARHRPTTASIC